MAFALREKKNFKECYFEMIFLQKEQQQNSYANDFLCRNLMCTPESVILKKFYVRNLKQSWRQENM